MASDGRTLINTVTSTALAALVNFYYPLRWMMLLAAVLIIMDLRWGLSAARKRGEVIRRSRAMRRTINKMTDYFCWITIAGILKEIFGGDQAMTILHVPICQFALLIGIYLIELDSCYSNYCESRGITKRWNILKWVTKKTELEICEQENSNDNEQRTEKQ